MEKNKNYECGINNEKKVANKYKKKGATKVTQMPGSRGAYDLEVSHASRKKHLVQVKSTCKTEGKIKMVTIKERTRLINEADNKNAVAVIAYVSANGRSVLKYAKNNRNVIL